MTEHTTASAYAVHADVDDTHEEDTMPEAHATGAQDPDHNPYVLRLIDDLREDLQAQTSAMHRLVDTLQTDNREMRATVKEALTASADTFASHSARLDKTMRWVVGGALTVVIVCLVALGAVVDSRISVQAGTVRVGAAPNSGMGGGEVTPAADNLPDLPVSPR